MQFLKRNWDKIILATLLLVGAILFIMLLSNYDASYHDLKADFKQAPDPNNASGYLFTYFAALAFFLLGIVFVATRMFSGTKGHSKWVLLAIGVLCTVLMSISIVNALGSESSKYAKDMSNGKYDNQITLAVRAGAEVVVFDTMTGTGGPAATFKNIPIAQWPQVLLDAYNKAVTDAVNENAPDKIQTAKDTASYQYISRVVTLVSYLILFGLLPLIVGVKKVRCERKGNSIL